MPPRTNKPQPPKKSRKSLVTLSVLLLLLVAAAFMVLHRQDIYDQVRLHGYQAPSTVSTLATQDTMTASARKMFYVNHPAILAGVPFGQSCPNDGGEQTIVLGCYHGNQRGIYLLGVTDTKLNGVEQVTAAHEMLHAAYDRLSPADRKKVDAMLQDYYEHNLHDARIQATIAAYKKSEPHDVVNEMHSVFGTEIASLPSGLEAYYKRYFTNRATVAAFAAQYQNEFTSRQIAIEQADVTLAGLKVQINNQEAGLKNQLVVINTQQAKMLQLRSSNVPAYNAAVPGFNQQVDSYNRGVDQLHSLISQYNTLVAHRNATALEEDQLVKELRSSAASINK